MRRLVVYIFIASQLVLYSQASSYGHASPDGGHLKLPTRSTTSARSEFDDLEDLSIWPDKMSDDAREMAQQLGLMPLIDQYMVLRKQIPLHERPGSAKLLSLRQDITDVILITLLEVQSVTSKVNLEVAHNSDLRALLEDRRDRAVKYNSIANVIAGTVTNVIGVALQTPTNKNWSELPGEVVELVGGGAQSGFGVMALKADGGSQKLSAHPNLLAKVFDRTPTPQSEYPPSVWVYLNAPLPNTGGMTRKEQLVHSWVTAGLAPDPSKPENKHAIDVITGAATDNYKVNIDMLEEREIMLADLRAVVSQMEINLLQLMLFLKR